MYNASNTIETRHVTIRQAGSEEWDAIDRLAQLDSAPPPPREQMLVAEIGGDIQAAVSVRDDYAIADPFARSGELIELLRARAVQVRGGEAGSANGRGRAPLRSLGWLRSQLR